VNLVGAWGGQNYRETEKKIKVKWKFLLKIGFRQIQFGFWCIQNQWYKRE